MFDCPIRIIKKIQNEVEIKFGNRAVKEPIYSNSPALANICFIAIQFPPI